MNEIVHGVYALPSLKLGRSYLIEDRDGLTLVDTSSDGAATNILAAIASIGRKPEHLRTIVATHYHFDHIGNVAALVAASGAKLHVHADDVPYVEARTPWPPAKGALGAVFDRFAPAQHALKVDCVLHDGDELPFAGGARVVHAPGHTPGHIAIHAPPRRTLFVGDALMNLGGLRLPMAASSHDMAQARRTIAALAELDFDIALPGHGAPIIGRANEKLGEWANTWL